jgi:hypothetical protein
MLLGVTAIAVVAGNGLRPPRAQLLSDGSIDDLSAPVAPESKPTLEETLRALGPKFEAVLDVSEPIVESQPVPTDSVDRIIALKERRGALQSMFADLSNAARQIEVPRSAEAPPEMDSGDPEPDRPRIESSLRQFGRP